MRSPRQRHRRTYVVTGPRTEYQAGNAYGRGAVRQTRYVVRAASPAAAKEQVMRRHPEEWDLRARIARRGRW